MNMNVYMYTCKRCGYETAIKSRLVSHLSRKRVCEAKYEDTSSVSLLEQLRGTECLGVLVCETCGKSYSRRGNLNKHICRKYNRVEEDKKEDKNKVECNVMGSSDDEIPEEQLLIASPYETKGHILEDVSKKGNDCKEEDVDVKRKMYLCNMYEERIHLAIPDETLMRGVDHPYEFILNALRLVHFNDRYMEGQNVKSVRRGAVKSIHVCPGITASTMVCTGVSGSSGSTGVCMVFKKGTWTAYRQDKVCKMLMHQSLDWLDTYVRKKKRYIPVRTKKSFYEFRNTIQEERDSELLRTLLGDIERVLESHSDMVDMERQVEVMESPEEEECASSDEDDV